MKDHGPRQLDSNESSTEAHEDASEIDPEAIRKAFGAPWPLIKLLIPAEIMILAIAHVLALVPIPLGQAFVKGLGLPATVHSLGGVAGYLLAQVIQIPSAQFLHWCGVPKEFFGYIPLNWIVEWVIAGGAMLIGLPVLLGILAGSASAFAYGTAGIMGFIDAIVGIAVCVGSYAAIKASLAFLAALLGAPIVRPLINVALKGAESEKRIGYWATVGIIIGIWVFRRRLAHLREKYLP